MMQAKTVRLGNDSRLGHTRYDIHWNPVRLIQRIGRIDRIGSEHDAIHLFNFMPAKEIEAQIHLRAKVLNRIQEFQDTIGADSRHLDHNERINDKAMFAIYEKDVAQLDLFGDQTDTFSLAEAEELIRNLAKTNPELLARIKALPDGVRSARAGSAGIFGFFEAGKFRQLWLADAEGKITTRDMERVLAAIKCEATESKKPLPPGYNTQVNRLFRQFKEETKLRDATMDHTVAMHHAQKYLVRELTLTHRVADDVELRSRIELLDGFVRRDPSVPLLKEFQLLKKQGITGEALVQKLADLYFKYPHDEKRYADEQGRKLTAERIICTEALV